MLTIHSALIFIALALTIVSFIPRLTVPWQVPVLLTLIALLVP